MARFCDREGVSIATFYYWQRKLRGVAAEDAAWSTPALPAAHFDAVEVVSRQSVTIRFAGGAVMEIPEDREDLLKATIRALLGEPKQFVLDFGNTPEIIDAAEGIADAA